MPNNTELCEVLEHLMTAAPYLIQFSFEDISIAICDREKVLLDIIPKLFQFDKPTYVGEKLLLELTVYKAMIQRKCIINWNVV